ncbi:MAG: CYTH domain-containing protein [Mailhella sp.]|nr:CYTH domain-containing protein [Mailhella sp.]
MHQEIERKFLVKGNGWRGKAPGILYRQGYLARTADRVVRVRVAGDRGTITIKIKKDGLRRDEFEYGIPLGDAMGLLDALSPGELIEKRRHTFEELGHTWEVDEFLGANEGLVVAEVELGSEDEDIALPEWTGEEVSRLSRYLNVELCANPYKAWRKDESAGCGQGGKR